MDQQTQSRTSGAYTANLLGNIKSHLAGLQGYDVMALELIQNADDAKAEEIIFDITDQGLLVTNSGQFTYCGDLHTRPCRFQQSNHYGCDYHRIADVGSGGKLARGENIGRFGIGFVSTYQITDHPEIRSAGIKLTLHPEASQWFIEPFAQPNGTTFFLPWARDPQTEARLALGVSHVSTTHIDQLTEDCQRVLRKSLLFLRHVRKAEVRRDGTLLLACDLERGDGSDLIVSFRPGGEVEYWHILRADAAAAAERLYATHPRLATLDRDTQISVGLRMDPEPLTEGFLYAFLPTEQSTGLPLHIHADFFPEADRKAVIFAGHQHEQAWNEMLIDAAAAALARDPEGLLKMLGHVQLWEILSRALALSRSQNHPACFSRFWEQLKGTAAQSRLVLAQDGDVHCPSNVFLPRTTLTTSQAKALQDIGGRTVIEALRPYHTAMVQLGAPILTLERMVNLLEQALDKQSVGVNHVSEQRLANFYRPLWSMVNDLLPEGETQNPGRTSAVQKLLGIPFVVTEDLFLVTLRQAYLTPESLDAAHVASILPRLAIASRRLLQFLRIARLIRPLGLRDVVSHIHRRSASEPVEDVISVASQDLRALYALCAALDRAGNVDQTVYHTLRDLPIWLSSKGVIRATHALLPGNFTDPTGEADLLDITVLTDAARAFVSSRLGVQTQTIEAFVQTVLPRFFNDDGPLDEGKYSRLIAELANHSSLVNHDNIRHLLGSLPMVPTQDGRWSQPTNTYRRTETLVKILGEAMHLWLDGSRVPNTRSVHTFLDSLGIRQRPLAQHLVERMLSIAKTSLPTEDAKRASSEAFYALCDNYDEWKDTPSFQAAIETLRGTPCFPAEGESEQWHAAAFLHAPYRAEAFKSQAHILDFRNTGRLKTDLLEELHVSINPETPLVIAHLRYCVDRGVQPHVFTYQILNERAQKADPLIPTLAGSRCIYVESQQGFVRSNQLFWTPQQLGRYAFTIPGHLEPFKPLFDAMQVKNFPEAKDYVDIVLDIVGEHFAQATSVTEADRAVYDVCLSGIASVDELDQLELRDLRRLQEAPTILNLRDQPRYPDELLLQDSEWHAGFFSGELDPALCKPAPELWPLLEKVGVKRLSECAEVALEFVDGPMASEAPLAEKLVERTDIFVRLLHDKPTAIRRKISTALSALQAVSYEIVRIQATVHLGGNPVPTPPMSVQAFYDIDDGQLILARPVGDRSWPHILNALLHQLMPEESGSEIAKLTLGIRSLMVMPVVEAHRELTDAGIPLLEASSPDRTEDLTSPQLDDIGGVTASEATQPATTDAGIRKPKPAVTPSGDRITERQSTDGRTRDGEAARDELIQPNHRESPGLSEKGSSAHASDTSASDTRTGASTDVQGQDYPRAETPRRKKRATHKEQWDRRLLSYVRMKGENADASTEEGPPSEHNLAVEVAARQAVCAYEAARGRVAEQMSQTNPGYDIMSRNPTTGEERIIEVKGVNGEWNQTGVGLSRLQFSNAQDYGEKYWLYVVEFIADPEHLRVHPIQSPATQVTAFMFDGNWREAVTDERADPALAFIVGARVNHKSFGLGRIESVKMQGSSRVMTIAFDQGERRLVTLNLTVMEVVGDYHGDDAS